MAKTILIAGGTDGIGLAFLKRCVNSKSYERIYVLGRNLTSVKRLKNKRVVEVTCDITNLEMLQSAIKQIGPLDEFVNTIGTFLKKPANELTPEEIQRHFQLNSISNITLTTLVLPKLRKTFSQILVCLATLAVETHENYSLQSATKGSYRFFLDSLRKEIGENTRVMMIHPSSVQTKIFAKSGDTRDATKYPSPDVIAEIMEFMLNRPKTIEVREISIYNRS